MSKLTCCTFVMIIIGVLVSSCVSHKSSEKNVVMIEDTHNKFKVGMSMDETKRLITEEYIVQQAAVEFSEIPSKEEYETTEEFLIELKQERISLHFNHNRILVRVENMTQ